MKVRSIRIPDDIEQAIEYVAKIEKVEKMQSLRKLARVGFESYIIKSYRDGKVTLREASRLLNLNLIETIDLAKDFGVNGNISSKDVLASLRIIGDVPQNIN